MTKLFIENLYEEVNSDRGPIEIKKSAAFDGKLVISKKQKTGFHLLNIYIRIHDFILLIQL